MPDYTFVSNEIRKIIAAWEPKLMGFGEAQFAAKNSQERNIKMIVGHMIDSASNNTHRIIHLQYQDSPVNYPDYANLGNNDKWIAIQNYEKEDWHLLVQHWKYSNLHIAHVIEQVEDNKVQNVWVSALGQEIMLNDMIVDYTRHLKLHIGEIEELL
jgi:hypothetical protein